MERKMKKIIEMSFAEINTVGGGIKIDLSLPTLPTLSDKTKGIAIGVVALSTAEAIGSVAYSYGKEALTNAATKFGAVLWHYADCGLYLALGVIGKTLYDHHCHKKPQEQVQAH
jgi:hypothetical protein